MQSGKYLVYEPSVRVPMLVRGPGIPAGRTSDELAANVDLAATVVDAADADPGRRLDGRSLLPFARRPSRDSDRAILLETGQTAPNGDLDQDGGPLGTGRNIPTYRAVRTDRYKYVEHSTGDLQLRAARRVVDARRAGAQCGRRVAGRLRNHRRRYRERDRGDSQTCLDRLRAHCDLLTITAQLTRRRAACNRLDEPCYIRSAYRNVAAVCSGDHAGQQRELRRANDPLAHLPDVLHVRHDDRCRRQRDPDADRGVRPDA